MNTPQRLYLGNMHSFKNSMDENRINCTNTHFLTEHKWCFPPLQIQIYHGFESTGSAFQINKIIIIFSFITSLKIEL